MIDDRKARDWLLSRLNQPGTMTRLERLEDICEEFAEKPADKLTESDLLRIWTEISNGVSDLPSTSNNLVNAANPLILRAASKIAQNNADQPGTRWIKLTAFFRQNGERYNQLSHYVRAVALFDPGNAPTVTAYRGLAPKVLTELGYNAKPVLWESLIQNGDEAALNPAIRFSFETIRRILPGADIYAQAIGLELLPGYAKEVMSTHSSSP